MMNKDKQGRPPEGHPHGEPPHGKPPHGKPPHGKPPHGKPPHGKPPHGKPPHSSGSAPLEGKEPFDKTVPYEKRPPISREQVKVKKGIEKDPMAGPPSGGPPSGEPGGMPRKGPGGPPVEKANLKDTKATVTRVFSYLNSYKGLMIFALFCVAMSTCFSLLSSYMLRPITNGILENTGTTVLKQYLGIMFGAYVISQVCTYLQSRIMLEIAQKALEKIRIELYTKLQKLPLKYFDTHNNGDVMSRFTNDIDALTQMLSSTLVQVISGIITLIGTLSLMIYTNLTLTVVTILMIPIFGFIGKTISMKTSKYYGQRQRVLGELNGFVEETITGQKVVKVFSHEGEIVDEFEKLNEEYKEAVFYSQFVGGIMGPVMGNLGQFNYTFTALIGGLLCVFKGFDVGGYTIFMNYSRTFSRPITELSNQVNTIFAALAGAERVFEVMDQEPEPEDVKDSVTIDNIRGEISLKNVDFSYTPEKKILKNISLEAKRGEKIAFVGSTGAGKTTITNLLNRFYDISSGEILIDGVNIQNMNRKHLRENIAMVLQDTHLFTGTVMENIRYGRLDATDEEVIAVAKATNAHAFIRRLENGYDTVLEGDGANLSQGQRQLLNIARTAISKAPILVLDEATSSVDTRTEQYIQDALDKLMETRTTFVIAHRLSTVRNSDRIMVLEQGEIIEHGTHDELLALEGKYYSLYTGLTKLT